MAFHTPIVSFNPSHYNCETSENFNLEGKLVGLVPGFNLNLAVSQRVFRSVNGFCSFR